ncbi:CHAT domain-containing protein, partial [Ephemerocybe angulata]
MVSCLAIFTRLALKFVPGSEHDLEHQGDYSNERFTASGNLVDLDDAIDAFQTGLQIIPQHIDLPRWLSKLGIALWNRSERTGTRLQNLAASFGSRFKHTGDLADLDESIAFRQWSVRVTPEGHKDLQKRLFTLGAYLQLRSQRLGNLKDIEEAIAIQKKLVLLTPEEHPDMPMMLTYLSSYFHVHFGITENLDYLAQAIALRQRALLLTPEGHLDLPIRLNCLGSSFQTRYDSTRNLADLAEAITLHEKSLLLTPEGDVKLRERLNYLSSPLQIRFQDLGNLDDLSKAMALRQKALQLTPEGHSDLPIILTALGTSFGDRFHREGNLEDLAEAISLLERALVLTPQGHETQPLVLTALGSCYHFRFERSEDLAELRDIPGIGESGEEVEDGLGRAILLLQGAVELTIAGDAFLASRLYLLSTFLYSRVTQTNDPDDIEACFSTFERAALCEHGPPRVRLDAAVDWARLLQRFFPSSSDTLKTFNTAVGLIEVTAGLKQTVQLRYTHLQNISWLPLEAAAAACALERPDKALEWLDQGRCLVWGQLTNLRTPLDDLRSHDPALAQVVIQVSTQLDRAGSSRMESTLGMELPEKIALGAEARNHLNLAQRWGDLLNEVRAILGFEAFLKPLSCSTLLRRLPDTGVVVVINMTAARCDAIALLPGNDQPRHIPLPTFTLAKCNQYKHILDCRVTLGLPRERGGVHDSPPVDKSSERAFGPARRNRKEHGVRGVLRCLWGELVKPILEALKISKTSASVLPRIWWCPTGSLSFLPIHAAGIYGENDSDCLIDYAVSSYIPTVAALIDRVKASRSINKVVSGIFLTSQPHPSGASPIPGTTQEVRSIHSMATKNGVRVEALEGDAVTIDKCLESMEAYSIIHLACHASQNATDPLESRFLFHSGSLRLGRIIQQSLRNADLAFLSACQTSTGQEKLSDEAVHLAAGMLAAGYRRVVATMWAIGDTHAPAVARDFYQYLWSHGREEGGGGCDGKDSAYALHYAAQQLRLRLDDSEQSLLAWI